MARFLLSKRIGSKILEMERDMYRIRYSGTLAEFENRRT